MKTYITEDGKQKVTINDEYEGHPIVVTPWVKDNKVRLYVKVTYSTCRPSDCGYVDMVEGKSCVSSKNCKYIGEEIEITEATEEDLQKYSKVGKPEEQTKQEPSLLDNYTSWDKLSFIEDICKEAGVERIPFTELSNEKKNKIASVLKEESFSFCNARGSRYDITFLMYNNNPIDYKGTINGEVDFKKNSLGASINQLYADCVKFTSK
ncbi:MULTISPECIES: hypothetical protein [Butyricimonas]|uniref:hypothetical protein n=1 Tax=Butyricimonas TaxID=574697 RepID=UPI0007FB5368|nr:MULTISPECIES: hypothetical protein [Butyricimonas]